MLQSHLAEDVMLNRFKLVLLALIPVSTLSALAAVALIVLAPSSKAMACLPCDCPDNRALNCYGGFHLNTIEEKNGTCSIEVLGFDRGGRRGYKAIYATAREIARVPENPEINTVIEQYYEYALYRLTTGEFQLNAGPFDEEDKVYVVIFTGCPATNISESTYIAEPAQ